MLLGVLPSVETGLTISSKSLCKVAFPAWSRRFSLACFKAALDWLTRSSAVATSSGLASKSWTIRFACFNASRASSCFWRKRARLNGVLLLPSTSWARSVSRARIACSKAVLFAWSLRSLAAWSNFSCWAWTWAKAASTSAGLAFASSSTACAWSFTCANSRASAWTWAW